MRFGLAFATQHCSVLKSRTCRFLNSYHFPTALKKLLDCLVKLFYRKRHLVPSVQDEYWLSRFTAPAFFAQPVIQGGYRLKEAADCSTGRRKVEVASGAEQRLR